MNKFTIKDIRAKKIPLGQHSMSGWVKTHRSSKNVCFIEFSDGSTVKGLQLVIDPKLAGYQNIANEITTGAAISFSGELTESPGKGQNYEFQVSKIELVGPADPETYVLQKKHHSLDFLREHFNLRPRTNTIGAISRLRSNLSFAVHEFFKSKNFYHIHTPIITTSDCEGAGEMFQVTSLDLDALAKEKTTIDYQQDFFHGPAYLTVSGQLEAEIFALALSNVYTFGPTFRAENSNTTRHLAEFWMIEPEMAFCDLEQNAELAAEFIQYLIKAALNDSAKELEFLHQQEWAPKNLSKTLENLADRAPVTVEYTEAIKILEESKQDFEFDVHWGMDLQAEHEKFLVLHLNGPVFVINYPKDIKPFYMRQNEDGRTVAAMDLLMPGVGEIIGGGQREERETNLVTAIKKTGIDPESYLWYRELRQYGSVPHAGFGMGFERLLLFISGMQNIRDVIPIPRFPGHGGV